MGKSGRGFDLEVMRNSELNFFFKSKKHSLLNMMVIYFLYCNSCHFSEHCYYNNYSCYCCCYYYYYYCLLISHFQRKEKFFIVKLSIRVDIVTKNNVILVYKKLKAIIFNNFR